MARWTGLAAWSVVASFCSQPATVAADVAIGWQELTIPGDIDGDSDSGDAASPALDVSLWYPTADRAATRAIGDNPVFVGVEAVPAAPPPAAGNLPLVVLSHGFGGHQGNLAWLAGALAEAGHVIAALDHPGTTTRQMRPGEPMALASRAADIGRVIDALVATRPALIDADRIAVIGHSLGAWTAMQLAGARFSLDRALADCELRPELAACEVLAWAEADGPEAAATLAGDRRDARVAAVIALDIGMARGFTDASLAAVEIPVLVIAAGKPNPRIPAAGESGRLSADLPAATTRTVELAEAGHFSFMPLCKPGAVELLAAEEPGDEIVCLDAGDADRRALHAAVVDATVDFLGEVWLADRR